MGINYKNILYKRCLIKPFENQEGVIIAVCLSQNGIEYKVRYCLNGEYRCDWMFDFDIEVCGNGEN